MRSSLFITAVITAILCPWPALGTCAPGATSFCQRLPDRTSKIAAIFVGIVREVVTPARTLPPLPFPGNPPAGIAPQGRRRAGDPVPALELKYPTARFEVIESFAGAQLGEFELRMTSDLFLDGIPQHVPAFAVGEIWLVEAYRDARDQQWITSTCQRNKEAARAEDDLRVLRAWVRGQSLPARVDGEVFNSIDRKYVSGVGVSLRGDNQTFSTTTDSGGHFSFENLPPGIYEPVTTLPRAGGPLKIDLTNAWCSRPVLIVQ